MANPVIPIMPIIRIGAILRRVMAVITRAGVTTITTEIESMYMAIQLQSSLVFLVCVLIINVVHPNCYGNCDAD
jgi:hypothetical protein